MSYFNGQVHAIPQETIADLKIVLYFVERWNKQDKEKVVATAAANLESYIDSYESNDL